MATDPIQPGVVRLVDDAHPARAELAHDAIRPELRTSHQCHRKAEYIAGPSRFGLLRLTRKVHLLQEGLEAGVGAEGVERVAEGTGGQRTSCVREASEFAGREG